MANWLTKIIQQADPTGGASNKQLPAVLKRNQLATRVSSGIAPAKLPNATVVYGVAASILFVIALLSFFSGAWFSGILVLLLALGFLGFALHFLKHPNS